MEPIINEFLNWAWERHHNPLSWYIRPLFVIPFCYFAYKKSVLGVVFTIVAVLSSMFWFPMPNEVDPQATKFLETERAYITGKWTFTKVAMTTLVPAWFFFLARSFWNRSWLTGLLVINLGTLLKVIWSFYFAGASAWSIIPPVAIGAIIINSMILAAYQWMQKKQADSR